MSQNKKEEEKKGGGVPSFRVSKFPSFHFSEFPSFRVTEFQSFRVSKFPSFQGRGGGRTNERPGTNHVTSGPMRGFEKKLHLMVQTNRQTDRQTHGQATL